MSKLDTVVKRNKKGRLILVKKSLPRDSKGRFISFKKAYYQKAKKRKHASKKKINTRSRLYRASIYLSRQLRKLGPAGRTSSKKSAKSIYSHKTAPFPVSKKTVKKKSIIYYSRKIIRKIFRQTKRKTRKFIIAVAIGKKKRIHDPGDIIWNLFIQTVHPWKYHPRITVASVIITILSGSLFYIYIIKNLPNPKQLISAKTAQTTIIRDRNGTILYRVYKNANRVWLSYDEIPQVVKDSTIAIEDAEFYSHHGISLRSIARAVLHNLRQENIKSYQGASTITQQLVKNRLLTPEKTYTRKMKEMVLALWTELIYGKKDILTLYLNEVGYGGPAYGIEAASQMYFGIPAKNLNLAQAAFLAGLPAAPTTFSPFGANPDLATIRQQEVLIRMRRLDMISDDAYSQASSEHLVFAPQKIDILAPHYVMYVKNELSRQLGEDIVEEGGLDVTTTLDLSIQSKAEEIVRKNIDELKSKYNIHNAAVLVTNPKSAEILAMVGSVDYFDVTNQGYVNATLALRQPGSSIKPVNYAYAFDHGSTPTSTIDDSPVVYMSPGSKEKYAPVNYDGKFHGRVTLRSALANSYNIPAVKLLNSYGVDNMISQGLNMGIKSWHNIPPVGLSLTLGGAEVTMLDMARVYGTINNLGVYKNLKAVKSIRDSDDRDLTAMFYEKSGDNSLVSKVQASDIESVDLTVKDEQQVVAPLSAYWLTDILADNVARLPAFGSHAKLTVPNHKVAVKTGTSNNFRDNWTIGYTPSYLVATWVGNNDGSFMNKRLVSGITGAAPIWNEVMTNLLADKEPEDFPVPEGLIPVKICATNGLLTCPNCPQEKTEYFTADKVPTKKCFFRSKAECDTAKTQAEAENKSEEEKKTLLSGCAWVN